MGDTCSYDGDIDDNDGHNAAPSKRKRRVRLRRLPDHDFESTTSEMATPPRQYPGTTTVRCVVVQYVSLFSGINSLFLFVNFTPVCLAYVSLRGV